MSNEIENFAAKNTPSFKKKKNKTVKKPNDGVHSQIETQLARLFTRVRVNEGHYRAIEELGQEGIDHINLNRQSKTALGYLLSTSSSLNFKVLGHKYSSINNLIGFYRSYCTDDSLKEGETNQNQPFMVSRDGTSLRFNNIYALVCFGYWSIFKTQKTLFDAVEDNKLPFDSYIEQNNKRIRHQSTGILINAIKEAHLAVKENRDPDISQFVFPDFLAPMKKKSKATGVSLFDILCEHFKPINVKQYYVENHQPYKAPVEEAVVEKDNDSTHTDKVEIAIEFTDLTQHSNGDDYTEEDILPNHIEDAGEKTVQEKDPCLTQSNVDEKDSSTESNVEVKTDE